MQFVYAMMSFHMIYCENSVKQNQRLSFDFECQSHNFAINRCLLSQIWEGGGRESQCPPVLIPDRSGVSSFESQGLKQTRNEAPWQH